MSTFISFIIQVNGSTKAVIVPQSTLSSTRFFHMQPLEINIIVIILRKCPKSWERGRVCVLQGTTWQFLPFPLLLGSVAKVPFCATSGGGETSAETCVGLPVPPQERVSVLA